MTHFAEIALDNPLRTLFTYKVPEAFVGYLKRGNRVLVPFRTGQQVGVCLNVHQTFDAKRAGVPIEKIKEILDVDANPLLPDVYLKWLEFAAEYYVCSKGMAIAQALPKDYWDAKDFHVQKVRKSKKVETISAHAAKTVILTEAQTQVAEGILKGSQNFKVSLIHGITGSGKTEVYMEVAATMLERGQSVIVLVPEIGLTPQTFHRFAARFGERLRLTHSGLTDNQRLKIWQEALSGEPLILVGTRSALFAPFPNLGLIVVDEEHDTSYKQDDRLRYNARDLAVARAKFEDIPVVLGSATPSLETYSSALAGRFDFYELKSRPGSARLPDVRVVDSVKERQQTKNPLALTRNLVSALRERLQKGEQAILFVAQRGYAQNAFCVDCRKVEPCPNCSVGLKVHSGLKTLKCHYCDFEKAFDEICMTCKKRSLTIMGIGIQGIEEELRDEFPGIRCLRVDSDSFPDPKKLDRALADFGAGKIDVLLGTQMVTKGHDFANVGLVGVVGLDAPLGLPDFRANERAFQMLVQVAGRAGRGEKSGEVVVQTHFPEHRSLVCGMSQDYAAFAAQELAEREVLRYPPFTRVLQIRWQSLGEADLLSEMTRIKHKISTMKSSIETQGIRLMGPVEMPIYKIRNRFRTHLLVKVPREIRPQNVLEYLLSEFEPGLNRRVQIHWDVDPQGLV